MHTYTNENEFNMIRNQNTTIRLTNKNKCYTIKNHISTKIDNFIVWITRNQVYMGLVYVIYFV